VFIIYGLGGGEAFHTSSLSISTPTILYKIQYKCINMLNVQYQLNNKKIFIYDVSNSAKAPVIKLVAT
jgi:hypothetical protein